MYVLQYIGESKYGIYIAFINLDLELFEILCKALICRTLMNNFTKGQTGKILMWFSFGFRHGQLHHPP